MWERKGNGGVRERVRRNGRGRRVGNGKERNGRRNTKWGGGEGRERVGSQTENRGRDEVMGEWERKRRRVIRRRKEKMGESTYTPT